MKNENRKKKSRNKAKRTLRSRSTSPRCTSSSEPDNYDGSLFHTMDELAPIRSTDFVPIRNLPDDASIREQVIQYNLGVCAYFQQQANTIDSTSTPPFSWTYSICSPAHYAVMSTCAGRRFDNLSSPGGSLSPLDLYRNGSSSSEGSSIASTFDDLPFPPNQQMEKVRCDNYIPLNVVNDSLTTFHVKPNSVSPNVIDPVFENTTQALSENVLHHVSEAHSSGVRGFQTRVNQTNTGTLYNQTNSKLKCETTSPSKNIYKEVSILLNIRSWKTTWGIGMWQSE